MSVVRARIIGGLGNQMFQYAAGFALASDKGVDLLLDISGYESYATWPYLLDRLRVPQDLATTPARRPVSNSIGARVIRRLTRGGIASGRVYREPHYHVDESFFDLEPPVTIEGYFQSHRYFSNVERELRDRFQLAQPMGPSAAAVAERMDSSACPVSVHVRRGDYVQGAAASTYAQLDQDYYTTAMNLVREHVSPAEPTYFIFSDDVDFARATFSAIDGTTVVTTDPARPYDDMHLMARCHAHIIANSTFGWWGAWLDPSDDVIVVAPSVWFSAEKQDEFDTSDLYPPDWIVI